jgi:hypothetical protein
MLTAEDRMELNVLRKHGASIRELGTCDGMVAEHGSALSAGGRSGVDAEAGAQTH